MTKITRPAADKTAPTVSKGRVGIGRHRVFDLPAEKQDGHDNDGLEHEGGSPTDGRRDETSEQRSHRRPHSSEAADQAERLGSGLHVGEQDGREDVDRRDEQGGPTPSRIEFPMISTPSPGAAALSRAPTP